MYLDVGKLAEGLEAHAGVVVGAFPEAGFVFAAVNGAVGETTPPPFAVLCVDDVGFHVVPAAECLVEGFRHIVVTCEVGQSDDVFCLYPPMAFGIKSAVFVPLIDE